jgi:hypothetical protein
MSNESCGSQERLLIRAPTVYIVGARTRILKFFFIFSLQCQINSKAIKCLLYTYFSSVIVFSFA